MSRISLFGAVASCAIASLPHGQVPVGDGVRTSIDTPRTTDFFGVELVSISGASAVQVPGLSAPGSNVNAATLDPITGELIVGGYLTSTGEVRKLALSGGSVASETVHATIGPFSIQDVEIGENGHYFAIDASTLYRVGRHTGAVLVWDTNTYPGNFNALALDIETNTLWATTFGLVGQPSVLLEYDLSNGPGPGATLFTFGASSGFPAANSGLDHDGNGILYLSGFGYDPVGATVHRYDTGTGIMSAVPGAPFSPVGDVWFDHERELLHILGLPVYWTLDPDTGVLTTIDSGAGVDTASQIVVNDLIDRTDAFPRSPSAASGFLFEAAAHGNAGELAGILITKIDGFPIPPLILALGSTDAGGFFSLQLPVPANTFSAGTTLTITGARKDTTSGLIVFGSDVDVVLRP